MTSQIDGPALLKRITGRTKKIARLERQLELERVDRAYDFALGAELDERLTQREMGAAAGMTHTGVQDAVRLLGPGTVRAERVYQD